MLWVISPHAQWEDQGKVKNQARIQPVSATGGLIPENS